MTHAQSICESMAYAAKKPQSDFSCPFCERCQVDPLHVPAALITRASRSITLQKLPVMSGTARYFWWLYEEYSPIVGDEMGGEQNETTTHCAGRERVHLAFLQLERHLPRPRWAPGKINELHLTYEGQSIGNNEANAKNTWSSCMLWSSLKPVHSLK